MFVMETKLNHNPKNKPKFKIHYKNSNIQRLAKELSL